MAAEVKHALAQAEADPAVVAIVITGEGRGFCAGADLSVLREHQPGRARRRGSARARRGPRRSVGRRGLPRHLHLLDVGAQADHRRDQRAGRGHGRADRALLRSALRLRPRRVHARVLEARARRRVGIGLAAAAPGRPRARARPVVLVAHGRRRGGVPDRPREPRRSARRAPADRVRSTWPSSPPRARPHRCRS